MDELSRSKTDSIREVFLYLHRFQSTSFVIKIDYPLTETAVFPSLMRDVAQLREIGINILIVTGARERIDDVLNRYGIENTMQDGVRISSLEAMPFVKMAAFDVANRIMTTLTANGISAVIGNWVRARTLGVVDGVDYMSTGRVERILTGQLNDLVGDGIVPIFPCIGWSATGEPYNVSSNELASVLAQSVQADKLFFVLKEKKNWPSRMTISEVASFIESGNADDHESLELLELAKDTCSGGVKRVHVIDGLQDGAILQEVFSNLGTGTMVYANQYEQIRTVKHQEIGEVLRIREPWVQAGYLVRKTHEEFLAEIDDTYVFEVDGAFHGCAGLRPYGNEAAEITGLAVDNQFAELGTGRRLVEFLIETAADKGFSRVFILTTQAFDWFRLLGFEQGDVKDLPEEKRRVYDEKRGSRVMFREITSK